MPRKLLILLCARSSGWIERRASNPIRLPWIHPTRTRLIDASWPVAPVRDGLGAAQNGAIVVRFVARDVRHTGEDRRQHHEKGEPRSVAHGFVYGLLAIAGLLVALGLMFGSSVPSPPMKTLAVTVAVNAAALEIMNAGAPAGREMIVYINGAPPFTYKMTATVPAAGASVRLPLRGFVTKAGDRFDPLAKAVTEVWVGGGGYDYRSFRVR